MAAEVGAANIRVGATIAGLINGMKQASVAVRGATMDMNSRLTDAYKRASREQAIFRGGLSKLGNEITGIGTKLQLFTTLPALFAAGRSFKDYAELQKLDKGLTRYGESMEKVREIAKLPNIGIFDGARSLISLKAMKLNSDLATRSIKAFANAITDAGGSAVDLEPALINLRQFVATKHINQVDLRQLAARMPQTYDAMEAAFKTQDVEKLNKKMGSMGVEKFIEKFIVELEKIPKAGGGAATAMEQLGDSATFFSGAIGEGADKAFDITGKISALGGVLDNLSTNFKSLTPEAQKSLYTIGAIAVVVPTLITAVGGLVKLLPLIATGFGAVSGPILAVIAVVGLAAAAIINNWDSVKKFLTDSTWWTTIVGIAKGTLGLVMEAFKVVLNLIQGDWSNMWKAIVNIGKHAANLVVDTLGGLVKGAMGLVGTFSEALGLNAVGRDISKSVKWIDGLTQKFRFDVPDSFAIAGKAISSVSKAFDNLGGGGKGDKPPIAEAVEYFEKLSEAARQMNLIDLSMKWQQEQDALKEKIKSYKELFGVVSGLNIEWMKASGSTLGNSTFAGLDLAKGRGSEIGDRKVDGVVEEATKNATKAYSEYNTQLAAAVRLHEAFGSSLSATSARKFFMELPQLAGESADRYAERLTHVVDVSRQLSGELSGALQNAATETAYAFGEMLGNLMTGAGGLEEFGKRVLGTLSGLLKEMGKSLIAAGTAGIALKLFVKVPAAALAAGVALVALGTATQNKISKQAGSSITRFAKGGLAYKEMTAIVGDNRNARFDPEMIAPYSKVDESIKKSVKQSGAGGGNAFIPELRLRGEDLYISFKRVEARNKNLRGF